MDNIIILGTDDKMKIAIGGEGISPAERKAIKDNSEARHTHDNKEVLDAITEEKVKKWDDCQGKDFIITCIVEVDSDYNVTVLDTSATYEEIIDAYNSGKNVKIEARLSGTEETQKYFVELTEIGPSVVCFTSVALINGTIVVWCNNKNEWGCDVTSLDNVATNSDLENVYEKTKLRDKRLKYYGDVDIVPSDESYFIFEVLEQHKYASVKTTNTNIDGELIIPYKCSINGSEYLVTRIEANAFYNCDELTSVTMPDSIKSFGTHAFAHCENLTNIILSNNVQYIAVGLFQNCSSLSQITIPSNVKNIDNYAFQNCSSLTDITIPDSVVYFGEGIFEGCDNLTITCAEGSAADTYAKANGIPVAYTKDVAKGYVDEKVGEIETALDTIIEIQNELIGGDGV